MFRLKSHAAMFALVIGLLTTFTQTARAESWSWENLFSFAVCTTNPVVVNNLDSGAGSLRQAVIDACAGGSITFSASMPPEVSLTTGQIMIDKNLTIQGPGADRLTVRNGGSSRIFQVNGGVTATISGLTIEDGTNGGISNAGTLTVADCVIRSNKGSGIGNGGNLTVVNSVLSDNENGAGGAIYNSGTAAITNSTILHNSAKMGGGIYNTSSVTITNSSITGNTATGGFFINTKVWGSAITNQNGRVTITNSTIAGNDDEGFASTNCYFMPDHFCRPGYGPEISMVISAQGGSGGDLSLINSTVTDNILIHTFSNAPYLVTARNSIINGLWGFESFATLNSQGNNLIVTPDGHNVLGDLTGNILGVNPRLGPLGYYGGSTMTHALLTGSPAIDAGNTATSPGADQRGASRVGAADIGAFELNNSANGGHFVVQLPDAFTEIAYSQLLVESTSSNYSLTGGALPIGILLSASESYRVLFSGRTAQTGVFAFSVTATDGTNSFVTDYSLRVLPSGAPPVTGCLSNVIVANKSDAGEGTLRQAVIDACAGGTITFGEAARGKIHLTGGPIAITKNLTIAGPGADALTLRSAVGSGHQNNVLVNRGVTAVISGLTVSDGFGLWGGGIQNSGNLTVRNVVLSNNRGIYSGGGIANYGTLTLDRTLVTGNGSSGDYAYDRRVFGFEGGGISSDPNASLTINDSIVSGNNADQGGGISAHSATITNSTISDNRAINRTPLNPSYGGGIYLDFDGMMALTNCTVSQNFVGNPEQSEGGGIFNDGGTLSLINTTVANNEIHGEAVNRVHGAGIAMAFGGALGTVNARNSIIAGNKIFFRTSTGTGSSSTAKQFYGTLTSQGYNLLGSTNGAQIIGVTTGNIIAADPRLSPLGDYGGPTQTHALLTGSPAINTGNTATSPTTDQRSAARVGTADIGAFELNNSSNGGAFVAQLPDGFVQTPYNYTVADFSVSDGRGNSTNDNTYKYTYTVTGGALPNGISLSTTFSGSGFSERENVKFIGTPTQTGIFNFSVTATSNGSGFSFVTDYCLVIGDSNPTPTPTVTPTATPTPTPTATPTPTITPTPSPTPTPNTPPSAAGDVYSVNEDATLNTHAPGVLGNDTDGENNSLTAQLQTSPANAASFALNADGSFSYTPQPNFNGTDSFTYKASDDILSSNAATVTITVNAVNDVPVANGGTITTNEDTPSSAFMLTGSDADNDALTFEIVTAPVKGTYNQTTGIYTPNANANGSDGFTFVAKDAVSQSPAATVSITITPVNDAPTAANQSVTTDEDAAKEITLSGGDVDGDALTYTASQPSHGSLSCTGASCTYTPTANYNGTDSFTFKANDGTTDSAAATVSITINPVNDPPTATAQSVTTDEDTAKAITLSGSDPDGANTTLTYTIVGQPLHGTLSGTGANRTYTPAANYYGADSFTFRVNDGEFNSETATISIIVNAVNDEPTLSAIGNQTLLWGSTVSFTPTATDADVPADNLTFSLTCTGGIPSGVSFGATTGAFGWTPSAAQAGVTYNCSITVNDNSGALNATATRSFSITVNRHRTALVYTGAVAGQYSDPATLTATLTDLDADGSQIAGQTIDFQLGSQTASGLSDGSATPGAILILNQSAATASVTPSFAGSNGYASITGAAQSFVISRENAVVSPSASNLSAVKVSTNGGTAASITLQVAVSEISDGSLGDITKAVPVTFTLTPIGPGSAIIKTAGVLINVGGVWTASVTFTSVPVNVYDITITVGGNYYTGAASSVLAVYDPSLGFTTGGGKVIRNGVLSEFGFNVKYLKNGNIQGQMLYVEHRATGDVTVKSNVMDSLSIIKGTAGSGSTAVIMGRATVNGVGNYRFRTTVVDYGEPGSNDKFGLQVKNPTGETVTDLTFSPITLNGGNIQVP